MCRTKALVKEYVAVQFGAYKSVLKSRAFPPQLNLSYTWIIVKV